MLLNHHISDANLSAYIDGEARRPERVRRHLQRCETCAARHLRMARLSSDVQSLPVTGPRHGFAMRVMARLNDVQPEPAIGFGRVSFGMGAVTAAAVALVAAFLSVDTAQQPVSAPQVAEAPTEEALMAELERRLAGGGAVVEPWLATSDSTFTPVPEVISEHVFAALARPEVSANLEATMSHAPDYRSELRALDTATAAAFRELLSDYARSELLGPYAKEG